MTYSDEQEKRNTGEPLDDPDGESVDDEINQEEI